MAVGPEYQALLNAKWFYWGLFIFFVAIWIPYRFALPLSIDFRHTYELPSQQCVNRLTSDRWTWEYVREGMFVLFILVPFTGFFMLDMKSKTGFWVHTICLLSLGVWSIVMVGYDIQAVTTANLPPGDGAWNPTNPANDKQWCLVYAGQPGTELVCANPAPCPNVPPVAYTDLRVDGQFSWRVSFNAFMLLFIIVDFIFTVWTWRRTLNAWDATLQNEKAEPIETMFQKYNILKRPT